MNLTLDRPTQRTDDIRHRRMFGALFGAALGLGYGLSSQSINHLLLPGIPLYQPPFGPFLNTLLWCLAACTLGSICAWPRDAIAGVFFSSLAAALAVWAITFSSDPANELMTMRIIAAVVFMVPLMGLIIPFLAVHRWVVTREVDGWLSYQSLGLRGWLPLALVFMLGGAGLLGRYGRIANAGLTSMHAMIQNGLTATSPAQMPEPLQHHLVGGFQEHAVPTYGLLWKSDEINRYGIPRPLSPSPNEEGAALAHFSNGWTLVCIYPAVDTSPSCRGFLKPPP